MEVHLIRHTAPAIGKGICYGQSDIGLMESFYEEAEVVRASLAGTIDEVYSSPLTRCSRLAGHLFPQHDIRLHPQLMEINCGHWEMRLWNEIPREETDPWMNDFVRVCIPGGESYTDLYRRVTGFFEQVLATGRNSVIVTHGGVIRSIMSHITGTPLADSFKAFSFHYGCVVRIQKTGSGLTYDILSNIAVAPEQHKPQY